MQIFSSSMIKPISVPFWKAYWLNKVVPIVVQYVVILIKMNSFQVENYGKIIPQSFIPTYYLGIVVLNPMIATSNSLPLKSG